MSAPVLVARSPDDLLHAVAAEGRGLDLAGAVVHDEGYENAVVETADGWILRFPRQDDLPFERELAILARLGGRLPVEIPRIAWTGRHSRFAAYRKLTGAALDVDAYLAAAPSRRDVVAGSLAAFLAAMHDALEPAPGPEVVLHNDFHHHNLVLTDPVGQLRGIWDFSCVEVGSPSWELRYLHRYPRDLIERVAGHYTRLTGRPVDVDAAIAAGRLERIQDAVQAGDPAGFDAVVERWRLDRD